jgi:hypothetical protein
VSIRLTKAQCEFTALARFGTDAQLPAVGDHHGERITGRLKQGPQDMELNIALIVPPAQFSGTLEGSTLNDNWSQGGMSNPLILTKE